MKERIIQDTLRLYEEEIDISTLEKLVEREVVKDPDETDPQFKFWQNLTGVDQDRHELKQSILRELRSANMTAASLRTLQNLSAVIGTQDLFETTDAKRACESIMAEVRGRVTDRYITSLESNPQESEYLEVLRVMAIEAGHSSNKGEVYIAGILQDLIIAFQDKIDELRLNAN